MNYPHTVLKEDIRVPTGTLQGADDWPGIFIRGDQTWTIVAVLRAFKKILEEKLISSEGHRSDLRVIQEQIDFFESCQVNDGKVASGAIVTNRHIEYERTPSEINQDSKDVWRGYRRD